MTRIRGRWGILLLLFLLVLYALKESKVQRTEAPVKGLLGNFAFPLNPFQQKYTMNTLAL